MFIDRDSGIYKKFEGSVSEEQGLTTQDLVAKVATLFKENIRDSFPEVLEGIKGNPDYMKLFETVQIPPELLSSAKQVILFCKSLMNLLEQKNSDGKIKIDERFSLVPIAHGEGGGIDCIEIQLLEEFENGESEKIANLIVLRNLYFLLNIEESKESKLTGTEKIEKLFEILQVFLEDENQGMTMEELLELDRLLIVDASTMKCPRKCSSEAKPFPPLYVARLGKTWYETLGANIIANEEVRVNYQEAKEALQKMRPLTLKKGYQQADLPEMAEKITKLLNWYCEQTKENIEDVTVKDLAWFFHNRRADIKSSDAFHDAYHFYLETIFPERTKQIVSSEFLAQYLDQIYLIGGDQNVYSVSIKAFVVSILQPPGSKL